MADKIREYNLVWTKNFLFGVMFYGTLSAMFASRYRRTYLGVPIFTTQYFNKKPNYPDRRIFKNFRILKIFGLTTFILSYANASYFTSQKHFSDEYLDKHAKPILPS